ncbi:MAG TPA: pyridine nucleotide-disulfide oxidoreductase, partial [Rhodobiaceae bacterium]|nr:pyridine nucleotide-disulfide oxidoreductase [Rhodobiaceae bacterium]
IGGDKISHAATRNMSCCAVTGQGAGVAAALSVKQDTPLTDVNVSAVQQELSRQDVRVH